MKIARVSTAVVALPADEPLADSPNNSGGSRQVVTLRLQTDGGIEGIGVTYLGAALTKSLRRAAQQLGELTIGDDPAAIEAIASKLHRLAGGSGPQGLFALALAAVEIALWDIKGKALGAPLWKVLGGPGDPVPCYASGAMMRELTLDQALEAARRLVEGGFSAMKFQLGLPGSPESEVEIERARLIREVVGPDIELMCDVNQLWSLDRAMTVAQRLEEFDLTWLEDPIAHDDTSGLSLLASRLKTPIAAGEYLYGVSAFRQMLEARALDVVMIDPFRSSGIGGWLRIAALAEEYGLRVVSHLAPEIQVHLVGTIGSGWIVEYMPWFNQLYQEVVWPKDGLLEMPRGPGLGVDFDEKTIARYLVEEERS